MKSFKALAMVLFAGAAVVSSTSFAVGVSESTMVSSIATRTSVGERIMAGRDIVILAQEDIDLYRATGNASQFLKEVVVRLSKVTKLSEAEVWKELEK